MRWHDSNQSATAKIVTANFRGPAASPGDIDSAIEQAAAQNFPWSKTATPPESEG